jgi:hypothetical protein
MTKVQPARTSTKGAAERRTKRMYRGIMTAQAIADVFVRATSDTAANTAMAAGRGQRTKPRFGTWELWQGSIAVDGYTASHIPAEAMPPSDGLTEKKLARIYAQVLRNICTRGPQSDAERQVMADAVREFYDLLTDAIRVKGGAATE